MTDPRRWPVVQLADVCLAVSKVKPDAQPEQTFTYIDISSIDNETNRIEGPRILSGREAPSRARQLVQVGDTVLSTVRTYLKNTAIVTPELDGAVASTGFCVLRPNAALVDQRFLLYRTLEANFVQDLSQRQTGTSYPAVRDADVGAMEIALPPLAEQHRIVAAIEEQFSRLDAGVASLQRAKRNLARMRAAVLQTAVQGTLLDQGSNEESVESVLAGILRARNGRLRTPCDGPWALPQTWRWATLSALFNVGVGTTPSRSNPRLWEGDVPWVSSGEVAFNRIGSTREHISTVALGNATSRLHPPGTVLLAMIGEGKTRGQAAILDVAAAHNQNCASIRVSETPISPEWVYWCLVQRYEETRRQSSGNNQPALNKSRVEAIDLPLPPLQEQIRIVQEVQRQMSIADAIDRGLTAALVRSGSLRQAVLREAFAGRLVTQDRAGEPAALADPIRQFTADVHQLGLDEVSAQ